MHGINLLIVMVAVLCGAMACVADTPADTTTRPIEDDIIYFLLPDRFANGDRSNDTGGLSGDRAGHGFDPTDKGWFHGGDLRGIQDQLDYIQGLGVTAIWMTPIYKNKPVQRSATEALSSGYHGYWVTDFTQVDPHLGSNDDLKALIDAAHARGMKVILDIITNHTADVIKYRECLDPSAAPHTQILYCPYRDKGTYPYSTRGDIDSAAINKGFLGDGPDHQTAENFDRLTAPDFAYTPYVPRGEEAVKVPAWLNDPLYYHNRGDSLFDGESSLYGDFSGLDDLMTEHPRVLEGLAEIYRRWIIEFDIDGYRIDTTRHVNAEFWQKFIPQLTDAARRAGRPNFYIFGEVFDPSPAVLARFTHHDRLPAVLDFAFQSVARQVISQGKAPDLLRDLFESDPIYRGGETAARRLPTFLGNHDMGRFATFLREDNPDISDDEMRKRLTIAHALMIFARGVPVIYYGDEQGFVGDGNDQAAREDMFASRVASYNDNDLVATQATTADENFDPTHPLYRAIARMTGLFHAHETLRRSKQVTRFAQLDKAGLFAFSRLDREAGEEFLVVINTAQERRKQAIEVEVASTEWQSLAGQCADRAFAPGSLTVDVPALGYLVCRSKRQEAAQ